ncbi:hypothetical protein PG993_009511 [Apiospora rasikravindrae]|uniref:Uncharacterized protein n=1 Tax=Apiospora rasikravindrae TaxID=990691 RepID=A0ABR1SJK9_9PEZI
MPDQHDQNSNSPVQIKSEGNAPDRLHDAAPPQYEISSSLKERQAAHQARMKENRETHEAITSAINNQYEQEMQFMQSQHEEIVRLHGDVYRLQDQKRELEAERASLKDTISEMQRTADETLELLALSREEGFKMSTPAFEVDDLMMAEKMGTTGQRYHSDLVRVLPRRFADEELLPQPEESILLHLRQCRRLF